MKEILVSGIAVTVVKDCPKNPGSFAITASVEVATTSADDSLADPIRSKDTARLATNLRMKRLSDGNMVPT